MKLYRIHVYGRTAPYSLVLSPAQSGGGSLPSVPCPSLDRLTQVLLSIGISEAEINKAKGALNKEGGDGYTIDEVQLSDEQVKRLGFVPAA